MARINLEDDLFVTPRFRALVRKCGNDDDRALGKLFRFWKAAQKRWGEPGRQLVSDEEFELGDWQELADTGWAIKREEGWYARGAEEQFRWYASRCDNARAGAKARWGSGDVDDADPLADGDTDPLPENATSDPTRDGTSDANRHPTRDSESMPSRCPPTLPLSPSPSPVLQRSRPDSAEDHGDEPPSDVTASGRRRDPGKFNFTDDDLTAATWMRDNVLRVNPSARYAAKANLEAWAHAIRLMREKLSVNIGELAYVLHWIFDEYDGEGLVRIVREAFFWQGVVQSPDSLRRNWDQITAHCWRERRKERAKRRFQ